MLYDYQTENISPSTSLSVHTVQYINNQSSINHNVPSTMTISSNNINDNERPPEYASLYDPNYSIRNIPLSALNNHPLISSTINTHPSIYSTITPHPSISSTINNHPSISSTNNNHLSISSTNNNQPYISNSTDNKISENNDDILDAYTCDDTNSLINSSNTNNKNIKNNKDDIKMLKDIKRKFDKDDIKISLDIKSENDKDDIRTSNAHELVDRNSSILNTLVTNSLTIREQTQSNAIKINKKNLKMINKNY